MVNTGALSRESSKQSLHNSQEKVNLYNHADLFTNIDKIDFAEPVMTFGEEETSADQRWLEITKRVFDGDRQRKINRYRKADKQ